MVVRRLRLASVVVAVCLVSAAAPAAAQTATRCAGAQVPVYVFGFADLKSRLGAAMGNPVTCEYADPNGTGDVHQTTSKGLSFWRKSTNTPTFTDGYNHWALAPAGLVYWTGLSIDPPSNAGPPRRCRRSTLSATSARETVTTAPISGARQTRRPYSVPTRATPTGWIRWAFPA